MDDQPQLRNPFRSEADAFRLLLIVGAAVAAIVLAVAIGGAPVGVPVAIILFAAGTRASYRWMKQSLAPPGDEREPPEAGSERR